MSRRGTPPVFLVRRAYRRRRMGEAARMLPLLGLVLFLLPAAGLAEGQGAARIVYLFAAWIVLIVLSALIARAVSKPAEDGPGGDA